jgi:hypothetical protein
MNYDKSDIAYEIGRSGLALNAPRKTISLIAWATCRHFGHDIDVALRSDRTKVQSSATTPYATDLLLSPPKSWARLKHAARLGVGK